MEYLQESDGICTMKSFACFDLFVDRLRCALVPCGVSGARSVVRKLVRISGLALRGLMTHEAVGRARDWARRLSAERGPARCAWIGPCRESVTRATWRLFEYSM